MKTRSRLMIYVLGTLLILLPFIGLYVAYVTYQYEIIVRGLLGSTVIYLLFYYLKSSKSDLPIKVMVLDPKIHRHLVYVFVGPMIAYWATGGIYDMILLFLKRVMGR